MPGASVQAGFYTERGLAVEVLHTPNSDVLRNGLAKGFTNGVQRVRWRMVRSCWPAQPRRSPPTRIWRKPIWASL